MTHAASFRGHIIEAIRIFLERNVVITAKIDGVNPALYDIASITGGARRCHVEIVHILFQLVHCSCCPFSVRR